MDAHQNWASPGPHQLVSTEVTVCGTETDGEGDEDEK